MSGIGPRAGTAPDTTPPSPAVTVGTWAARQAYLLGRREADWEIAAALLSRNTELRAPLYAEQEKAAYGPGGRARFADPRPGDFQGRGLRREPDTELEAG